MRTIPHSPQHHRRMPTISRICLGLWVVLAATLLLGACHQGAPEGAATVKITDRAGQEFELTVTPSEPFTLAPVAGVAGIATSLEIEPRQVAEVKAVEHLKLLEVTLRDGAQVSGRLVGSLEGHTADGPKRLPWSEVGRARFRWGSPPPPAPAPPGMWVKVHGDGIETWELGGLSIEQGWIVEHGSHAYRRDTKVSDILPFTVPRRKMVRLEWDLPIWQMQRIDVLPRRTDITVNLGGGRDMVLSGKVGSVLRRYEGDAEIKGVDHRGRWTLSLYKMRRVVTRVEQERGVSKGNQAPRISIELFGHPERGGSDEIVAAPVGNVTDWDQEQYPVVDAWLEQLTLRHGDDTREINPAEVREIKVHQDPWTEYDQGVWAEQWLAAELTLADGSRLTGSLLDRFGYLSCIGPGNIIIHLPSYGARRITLQER